MHIRARFECAGMYFPEQEEPQYKATDQNSDALLISYDSELLAM